MTPSFLLSFAAAALALHVIRLLFISWQRSRMAKSLGCGAVPNLPLKDPLGISNLRQSLAADREHALPELAAKRMEVMSNLKNRYVSTLIIRNLGRDNLFTADPKNIQALLATQFKDFGLGPARLSSLHQLLGTGIVSFDALLTKTKSVWLTRQS